MLNVIWTLRAKCLRVTRSCVIKSLINYWPRRIIIRYVLFNSVRYVKVVYPVLVYYVTEVLVYARLLLQR